VKNWLGLAFGTVFGFMLCWLGFTRYDTIFNALLLKDFYLWKVFIAGVVTGGAGLWVLHALGARTWFTHEQVKWDRTPVTGAKVVGGAIFGLGWAIAGTCPGPALAQIGSGRLSGLFTTLGIFVGIAACDRWTESRGL
jgi:uncharacterized membrane protein YedE/YeeE